MDGPDVRWDSHSHEEIIKMVSDGPGPALTKAMEDRLRQTKIALEEANELVSSAFQQAGSAWRGGAADVAVAAMQVLRSFGDGMHYTCDVAGIRAFGQSDEAGWVRANIPPVVEVRVPIPVGRPIDIIHATEDYQEQQSAAKQAELRAREIMQKYTAASAERAAAMTPLEPVPQVVLDVSEPPPPPRPGGGPSSPVPAGDGFPGPGGGDPVHREPGEAPVVARQSTQPATAPARDVAPAGETVASSSANPVAGGSGNTAPPASGFAGGGRQGDGSALGPRVRGVSGRGGQPGGGPAPGGRGPATGGVASGQVPARGQNVTVARGFGGTGGLVPFGQGPVAGRDDDQERKARFGLPSAEHFEPDQPDRDPHREGWHVAPGVIGDRDGDDDDQ